MDRRPEDEGIGLFLAPGIDVGIALGAGFGIALDNIALRIGIGVPLGTAAWISNRGEDGDG